ncbi:MAG: hypothetical protein H6728_10790 [Myxococcales bacterium]|nr:hypothetical protein [Myxococcales bacterium]
MKLQTTSLSRLGTSLFLGLGLFFVGASLQPNDAEAGCYWRKKRIKRCRTRYGQRRCTYQYIKTRACTTGNGGIVTRQYNRKVYRDAYGTRVYRTKTTRYRGADGSVRTYRRTSSRYKSRCSWRNVQKRYCGRVGGYYVRVRGGTYYHPYWKRVWVPGRMKCSYRSHRQRVCDY